MRFQSLISFVVLLVMPFATVGQSHEIDSLRLVIKNHGDDTIKAEAFNSLAWKLQQTNSDTSIKLSMQALKLSQQLNWKEGIGLAYNTLGSVYDDKGNYPVSIDDYKHALQIWEEIKNDYEKAKSLNNLGVVYWEQGDYATAIDLHFKALKIDEAMGNKYETEADLCNIGNTYAQQKEYSKALDYQQRALKISEEIKDTTQIAGALCNIATVYTELNKYQEAYHYYSKALLLDEAQKNKQGTEVDLGDIALVYRHMNEYKEAEDFYNRALIIAKELNNKFDVARHLSNIGELYLKQHEYSKAKESFIASLAMADSLGAVDLQQTAHLNLSHLYSETNDNKSALEEYEKYIVDKDSLYNIEKNKEVTKHEITYQFEKKEAAMKAEQDKKDAVAKEAAEKQKVVIYAASGGLLIALILSIFIFSQYRQKQRANSLLEEKNRLVAKQKKQVDDAFGLLHEKHKEVTDSINYATRIQRALFKAEEYVTKHLPEHFILFKPKDVVSGDFYWGYEKQGYWYAAAVDCTGHGVPGAFLTMLGSAFLNEISLSSETLTPAEILNRLRDKVVKELSGEGDVKDGMDISLARIQLSKGSEAQIQWAGANNPLWIVKASGEVVELNPDKQPIGYQEGQKPFTNHEITLIKGDVLYLFTDGYADQFGGPKGKKFKYKQLQQVLLSAAPLTVAEQKRMLNKTIEEWKGSLEQTDDVLIMGIKV